MSDQYHTQWVAEDPSRGWGHGASAEQALAAFAQYNHVPDDATATVTLTECRGYRGGSRGVVLADEIVTEEVWEIRGDLLNELSEAANRVNVLAKQSFVESERIDE